MKTGRDWGVFGKAAALFTSVLIAVGGGLLSTSSVAKAAPPTRTTVDCGSSCEEATLRQLIADAGTTPTRIVLSGQTQTALTSSLTIPAGTDIELVNGINAAAPDTSKGGLVRGDGFSGVMVSVEKGASLTMGNSDQGGTFDMDSKKVSGGELIRVMGSLTINGGTYHGVQGCTGTERGAITLMGRDASFTLNDGKITDNHRLEDNPGSTQYGAGNIAIVRGGTFVMNGGEVSYGSAYYHPWAFGEAGGIGIFWGGSATINGGEISHNSGWGGGLLAFTYNTSQSSATNPQTALDQRSYLTINGGKISQNTAFYSGGGAMAFGNAAIEMNGGTVDSNITSGQGGGIGTADMYMAGANGTYEEIPGIGNKWGYTPEEWNKLSPGSFTFNGGTISNNTAYGTGGGVYVASNQVEINSGQILNNTSRRQGGGIYVASVSYNLHLHEALVTANSAGIGGGIWSCPTGSIELRMHNGGAVFGNTAETFGTDLAHVNMGSQGAAPIWVSDYMLGGGRVDYYQDNENARFDPASLNKPEAERPKPLSMKYMSMHNEGFQAFTGGDTAEAKAKEAAKLVIEGNSAPYGGGIGTNGGVVFGDWGTAQATVEKAWVYTDETLDEQDRTEFTARAGDIPVKSLDMRLIRDTNRDLSTATTLQEFKLGPSDKPEDNWRKTFNDLPIKDDDGNFYYYGVQELGKDGNIMQTLPLKTWQGIQREGGKLPERPTLDPNKQPPETWLAGVVTNKLPFPVDVTINKQWVWKDSNKPVPNSDTPEKVTFDLVRATDDKFSDIKTVKTFDVTKADNWTTTITGLEYQNDQARRYYYGVREAGNKDITPIPFADYEQAEPPIQTDDDGIIRREVSVTNTLTPPEHKYRLPKTGDGSTLPITGMELLAACIATIAGRGAVKQQLADS